MRRYACGCSWRPEVLGQGAIGRIAISFSRMPCRKWSLTGQSCCVLAKERNADEDSWLEHGEAKEAVASAVSTVGSPATAQFRLDYVFASRGFHRDVSVRALISVEEWSASDHRRLLIEIAGT